MFYRFEEDSFIMIIYTDEHKENISVIQSTITGISRTILYTWGIFSFTLHSDFYKIGVDPII